MHHFNPTFLLGTPHTPQSFFKKTDVNCAPWCTIPKKNGAQCAPWCTNAPIFLCDGAQMPLRQTDIDGCKITPMSPPCKFYRQLAKKRKEAFAAITLDIVLNSEHAYLPYQTMYSMRRIS